MGIAKNNNLNRHREKQRVKNEALVRRAIKHIIDLGGEITFSSVSNVTYDIANPKDGEKGLTLPAISTSKVYRPIIEQAKSMPLVSNQKYGSKSNLSIGDMQVSLHGYRVENAKLKMDNKILADSLKELNKPVHKIENIESSLLEQTKEIHMVAKSLVDRLLELELAYLDTSSMNLNVILCDDVLVPHEALKLFYKKEIDAIQSKIS